jgi:hypothetical protein
VILINEALLPYQFSLNSCTLTAIISNVRLINILLNGPIDEEVYVSQPSGFGIKGKKELVYKHVEFGI